MLEAISLERGSVAGLVEWVDPSKSIIFVLLLAPHVRGRLASTLGSHWMPNWIPNWMPGRPRDTRECSYLRTLT
jgi:hypothetical protein